MVAPFAMFLAKAICWQAESIWRRLLMQALACEVARAFTKFGIAIAARRPIIATTIMISTSVKPALRLFLVCFIFFFFPCNVAWARATGGLYDDRFAHFHCRSQPHIAHS